MKVGVMGASGYAGVELLRLCAGHPEFEVAVATAGSHAGEQVAAHTPSLAAAYPSLAYEPAEPGALDGVDVAFLALPHGESQRVVPELAGRVGTIVDLAADFRLRDPALYPAWYGSPHGAPELLGEFVTGLPELDRTVLTGARRIAVPGCYPTAAILALAPLVEAGLLATGPSVPPIVVDAASGTSGAGRAPNERLHFAAVDEDFTAYSLLDHRHTPEIEQGIGARVLFTPHLAPMVRGILATCYAWPAEDATGLSTESALGVVAERFAGEPFVIVSPEPPSTKAVSGSNCARITVRVDPRTGWIVVLCAIDNLIKGAAGQAVQCANLALGLLEGAGLPIAGTYP